MTIKLIEDKTKRVSIISLKLGKVTKIACSLVVWPLEKKMYILRP